MDKLQQYYVNEPEPILWGGVGRKLSNKGTQWYQHERIYDADAIAICVCTCCNPYYVIKENDGKPKTKLLQQIDK